MTKLTVAFRNFANAPKNTLTEYFEFSVEVSVTIPYYQRFTTKTEVRNQYVKKCPKDETQQHTSKQ
jgi:hypothetical protein